MSGSGIQFFLFADHSKKIYVITLGSKPWYASQPDTDLYASWIIGLIIHCFGPWSQGLWTIFRISGHYCSAPAVLMALYSSGWARNMDPGLISLLSTYSRELIEPRIWAEDWDYQPWCIPLSAVLGFLYWDGGYVPVVPLTMTIKIILEQDEKHAGLQYFRKPLKPGFDRHRIIPEKKAIWKSIYSCLIPLPSIIFERASLSLFRDDGVESPKRHRYWGKLIPKIHIRFSVSWLLKPATSCVSNCMWEFKEGIKIIREGVL